METKKMQLKLLQGKIARKKHLDTMVDDLRKQQAELSDKAAQLKQVMLREQKDVDRLERGSLAAFFYEIIGKKDDKLTKEKQEAYAARVKYDATVRELDAVENSLRHSETELAELQGCQAAYDQLLQIVLDALKAAHGSAGTEIVRLENTIALLNSQLKEIGEAQSAGQTAMAAADRVLVHLDEADDWGTWDLFGGGLLANIAKYDALDTAQREVEHLQVLLRTFKTELVDISIDSNIQAGVTGFLSFADIFFDGLFADWAVMEQIGQAIRQVNQTKTQINNVLDRLNTLEMQARTELDQYRKQLNEVAVGT